MTNQAEQTRASAPIVHLAVYDDLADWEAGLAVAQIRSGTFQIGDATHDIRTVGVDREPVRTMGGVTVVPDLALDQLSPADSAMLIVPGGGGWEAGGHTEFPLKGRQFLDAGVPVAAICGAVFGFAAAGLLDDRDHTGAAAEYLAMTGYQGGKRYQEADAVNDRGLITAGPTESVAFAREVIAELGIWQPAVLDAWFRLFGRSEAAAYGELMSLVSAA